MHYHLSKKYIGKDVILLPKVPDSSTHLEGTIPRICVCTNIILCLRAILSTKNIHIRDLVEFKKFYISDLMPNVSNINKSEIPFINPSVYSNDSDIPYTPPMILDFKRNNEYWYIKPIKFKFIGYVCLDSILDGVLNIINNEITLSNEKYELNKSRVFRVNKSKNNISLIEITEKYKWTHLLKKIKDISKNVLINSIRKYL